MDRKALKSPPSCSASSLVHCSTIHKLKKVNIFPSHEIPQDKGINTLSNNLSGSTDFPKFRSHLQILYAERDTKQGPHCGPTILELQVILTVIWRFLLGANEHAF